ncbi:hypothetical protein Golomagni_00202 [Golovinomyces magnicellulatus]|nr:hypothetical protein Golomagni_00202 [Golovinomyces magnicellulatus]
MEMEDRLEDLPPEKFTECGCATTVESLDSAIQQGVIDLAIKYDNDAKGPTFLFRPFTENGKHIWSNFAELMDFDQFKKDFKQNPGTVFQEFKFRSLGLTIKSYMIQINRWWMSLSSKKKKIQGLNQQLAEANQVIADLMIRGRNQSVPFPEHTGTPST